MKCAVYHYNSIFKSQEFIITVLKKKHWSIMKKKMTHHVQETLFSFQ